MMPRQKAKKIRQDNCGEFYSGWEINNRKNVHFYEIKQ